MQMRSVPARRGWQWIIEGFLLFRKQPLVWIALIVVMLLIWFAAAMVPLLGSLAVSLLMPVFFAGLMMACRETDEDREPVLSHLFAAFKTHAAPLVTVGGIYLAGNIIAVGITFGIAGDSAMPALMSKSADIETMRQAMRGLSSGLVVGMAVFLPVLMAVWFAPLLIVFGNLPPVAAMKQSFFACLHNTMPFLVYGVGTLALLFIASIPMMLGLIVLLPVLVCSIYAGYKDIFPADETPLPQPDLPQA